MSKPSPILLILPKDLGDGCLCLPAIRHLEAVCASEGRELIVTGGQRSCDWIRELGGFAFPSFIPAGQEAELQAAAASTEKVINLNFYDALPEIFAATPVYQPERLVTRTENGADFGTGAVIGKKHISLLLEDCLKDAGLLGVTQSLPQPTLAPAMLEESFVDASRRKFGVEGKPYALLIPVCAANRPLKRWQPEKFEKLAQHLVSQGITPVLIGGPSAEEKALCADIAAKAPGTIDICGQTALSETASLAKAARFSFGNDTGPSHIAAASGAPAFILFGYYNDASTWAPRAVTAHIVPGQPTIQDVSVGSVLKQLGPLARRHLTPPPSSEMKFVA